MANRVPPQGVMPNKPKREPPAAVQKQPTYPPVMASKSDVVMQKQPTYPPFAVSTSDPPVSRKPVREPHVMSNSNNHEHVVRKPTKKPPPKPEDPRDRLPAPSPTLSKGSPRESPRGGPPVASAPSPDMIGARHPSGIARRISLGTSPAGPRAVAPSEIPAPAPSQDSPREHRGSVSTTVSTEAISSVALSAAAIDVSQFGRLTTGETFSSERSNAYGSSPRGRNSYLTVDDQPSQRSSHRKRSPNRKELLEAQEKVSLNDVQQAIEIVNKTTQQSKKDIDCLTSKIDECCTLLKDCCQKGFGGPIMHSVGNSSIPSASLQYIPTDDANSPTDNTPLLPISQAIEKRRKKLERKCSPLDHIESMGATSSVGGCDSIKPLPSPGHISDEEHPPSSPTGLRMKKIETGQTDKGSDNEMKPTGTEKEPYRKRKHRRRKVTGGMPKMMDQTSTFEGNSQRGKNVFADADDLKKQVRDAITANPNKTRDLYNPKSVFGRIALSTWFEILTMSIIAVNAVWIGIDMDWNTSHVMYQADPVFVVADNLFCLFFIVELLIRFLAFERKGDILTDNWFALDSCLVVLMICDTWLLSLIFLLNPSDKASVESGSTNLLILVKLARLARLLRLAKLQSYLPELFLMIKAIKTSSRAVAFTLLLLLLITYVFALILTTLAKDTPLESDYFATLWDGMLNIGIMACFPDLKEEIVRMRQHNGLFLILFLLYVFIAAFTVLNMLVGVLCEVVTVVAAVEKEEIAVNKMSKDMSRVFDEIDIDENGKIDEEEFTRILMDRRALKYLTSAGIDMVAMVDFIHVIFKGNKHFSKSDILGMLLDMRGSNYCTVKDVVDLRKWIDGEMEGLSDELTNVAEVIGAIHNHLVECGGVQGISSWNLGGRNNARTQGL